MITGKVRNRTAFVERDVSSPGQPPRRIEAVIDTDYNGYLTFPSQLITSLQLSFAGHRRGRLADGSVILLDVYFARVEWHGRQQDVLVTQTEGDPLIGMALLHGSRLTMDVIDGGDVIVDDLLLPP